jgi:hypothetical protein
MVLMQLLIMPLHSHLTPPPKMLTADIFLIGTHKYTNMTTPITIQITIPTHKNGLTSVFVTTNDPPIAQLQKIKFTDPLVQIILLRSFQAFKLCFFYCPDFPITFHSPSNQHTETLPIKLVLIFFKEMVSPLDLAKLTIVFIGKGDLQHFLLF